MACGPSRTKGGPETLVGFQYTYLPGMSTISGDTDNPPDTWVRYYPQDPSGLNGGYPSANKRFLDPVLLYETKVLPLCPLSFYRIVKTLIWSSGVQTPSRRHTVRTESYTNQLPRGIYGRSTLPVGVDPSTPRSPVSRNAVTVS